MYDCQYDIFIKRPTTKQFTTNRLPNDLQQRAKPNLNDKTNGLIHVQNNERKLNILLSNKRHPHN